MSNAEVQMDNRLQKLFNWTFGELAPELDCCFCIGLNGGLIIHFNKLLTAKQGETMYNMLNSRGMSTYAAEKPIKELCSGNFIKT